MSKRLAERLLEQGARAVGRAAGAVLSDPRGQEAMARAVGLAQRGLQLFESAQERALHAAGFAARPDYEELRKQVARLKRKTRELAERLDAGPGAEEPGARAAEGGALDEPLHTGFDEGVADDAGGDEDEAGAGGLDDRGSR